MLWRLNETSYQLLQRLLPDGIFTYDVGNDDGWIEDLSIYDGERLRLGVITHEGDAVVRGTREEHQELRALELLPT